MIPAQVLDEIFEIIKNDTSVTFIRENERGTVPGYPYGTYKQNISNEEAQHQNIREREEIDSESSRLNKYEKSVCIISISLLDKTVTERLADKTRDVLHWFKNYTNVHKLMASGVVPAFRGISITDRTVYGDSYFIGKLGFDIRMEYTDIDSEIIERIKTIEITPNYDGTDGENIIVGE